MVNFIVLIFSSYWFAKPSLKSAILRNRHQNWWVYAWTTVSQSYNFISVRKGHSSKPLLQLNSSLSEHKWHPWKSKKSALSFNNADSRLYFFAVVLFWLYISMCYRVTSQLRQMASKTGGEIWVGNTLGYRRYCRLTSANWEMQKHIPNTAFWQKPSQNTGGASRSRCFAIFLFQWKQVKDFLEHVRWCHAYLDHDSSPYLFNFPFISDF